MGGLGAQITRDSEARRERHRRRLEASQPPRKLGLQAVSRRREAAVEMHAHSSFSPRQPMRSSSVLRRLRPVCSRDFTVPSGMPSSSEMASSGRSR